MTNKDVIRFVCYLFEIFYQKLKLHNPNCYGMTIWLIHVCLKSFSFSFLLIETNIIFAQKMCGDINIAVPSTTTIEFIIKNIKNI